MRTVNGVKYYKTSAEKRAYSREYSRAHPRKDRTTPQKAPKTVSRVTLGNLTPVERSILLGYCSKLLETW